MSGRGTQTAVAVGLVVAVAAAAVWLVRRGVREALPGTDEAPVPRAADGTKSDPPSLAASDRATGDASAAGSGREASGGTPEPVAAPAAKADLRTPARGAGWDKASVPTHLHRLFGLDEGTSYGAQMEAAAALSAKLSDEDVAWLHAFLRWQGDGRQGALRLNAVKNDISTALQHCEPKRQDYAPLLLELHRSPDQDAVWRDYCLQHMGEWYPSADEGQRTQMREAMWEAARKGRDGGLAGTALIALRRNIGHDGIAREAVCDMALDVINDAAADSLGKITAVQVCATLGDARALPLARTLARGDADPNLRASAIAALGFLGDPEVDGALLRELAAGSDARLRVPAQAAMARMDKDRKPPANAAASVR